MPLAGSLECHSKNQEQGVCRLSAAPLSMLREVLPRACFFLFFFSSQRAAHLGPYPTAQGRARSEMRVAGGPGGEPTIVSIVGVVLFPFFDTREACSLRLVCRELKQAVADFPWEDMGTVIKGSIAQ